MGGFPERRSKWLATIEGRGEMKGRRVEVAETVVAVSVVVVVVVAVVFGVAVAWL